MCYNCLCVLSTSPVVDTSHSVQSVTVFSLSVSDWHTRLVSSLLVFPTSRVSRSIDRGYITTLRLIVVGSPAFLGREAQAGTVGLSLTLLCCLVTLCGVWVGEEKGRAWRCILIGQIPYG